MAEEKKQEGCPSEGCAGCSHASRCTSQMKDFRKPANPYSAVRKVIGVISGKGGVGKSMVTASLARMMIEKGYTAGILDADITGPSIPKMYGIHEQALGNEEGMLPCVAKDGTKIMSGHMARADYCRCSDTVLDRRYVGRCRLSFCGHASWDRRCSAYGISVSSGGRCCDRDVPAGSCQHDCKESLPYGERYGYPGAWYRGEFQLP